MNSLKIEEEGEVRPARTVRNPSAPTAKDAERRVAHLPYRSWCPECVAGRAKDRGHSGVREEELGAPELSMDYYFVRKPEEGENQACILIKDGESRCMFSSVVNARFADGTYLNKFVCTAIHLMGCPAVVLKPDNEPARLALRNRVQEQLRGRSCGRSAEGQSLTRESGKGSSKCRATAPSSQGRLGEKTWRPHSHVTPCVFLVSVSCGDSAQST